jgi:peptidoglycan/LPS O-acetylase OafA/YrhL
MTTDYAHTGGYVLTPARIGTLATGAWLACAWSDPGLRAKLERHASKVLIGSVALLAAVNFPDLRMYGYEPEMQTIGFPLLAAASAALLVLAMKTNRPNAWYQRMCRSGPLRFFGKYSYGMYILHLPVVVALEGLGITIALLPRLQHSDVPGAIIFTLVALVITTALAYASWHLFEKQFLKLKRMFRYDRSKEERENAQAVLREVPEVGSLPIRL